MTLFRNSSVELALLALGVTIVAAAFSVHPVKTSPLVFWVVMGAGVVTLAMGGLSHLRNRAPDNRQLVASECRRLYKALKTLLEEQETLRPKGGMFFSRRFDAWMAQTVERYEDGPQHWARKVFKQAVAARALSEASRSLLDAKTPSELASLRDLFRAAAEELEQRA